MFSMEIVGAGSFTHRGYRAETRVVRLNRDALEEYQDAERNGNRSAFMRKVFAMFGVDMDEPGVDGLVAHTMDDIFNVVMMKE
ncbi:MAG: hypothetical protein LUG44_11910 [Clostridiales bacterium]|nr:hypothetical protein [Clostridiales bacterium]